MNPAKKIIIIAPFWGNEKHVGHKRIERFIRWCGAANFRVVVVNAGDMDSETATEWGTVVTVKDPMLKYGFTLASGLGQGRESGFIKSFLRKFFIVILNPDVLVAWSTRIAGHSLVKKHTSDVTHVISSSPPESAHVAAYEIARQTGAKLIIDMRDGWLDETLSKAVDIVPLRKNREKKLERKILSAADHIFVTSDEWKGLLNKRLEFTSGKTTILTNAYPENINWEVKKTGEAGDGILLFHTGRFTGSSKSRKIDILLEILLNSLRDNNIKGKLILLGDLQRSELDTVEEYRDKFRDARWEVKTGKPVPRREMLGKIMGADGLVLLSTSHAAIPGKLFEYIPAGKPLLALTPKYSAVWNLGTKIPQLFLADYSEREETAKSVSEFLASCNSGVVKTELPEEFTEKYLSGVFLRIVKH